MSLQDVTGVTVFNHSYVKRATSTFGFNGTPTSLELELVDGLPFIQEDINNNATGYIPENLPVGTVTGIAIGNFNFIGHVKSYTFNSGPGGRTWTVRMEDPRWIFSNVYVNLGINNAGVDFPNFLNAFEYYGDPYDAERDEGGMGFRKIRDYLATSGALIRIFDKQYILDFSSGYLPYNTGTNPQGIPTWYRIQSNLVSLEQLFQQVAQDFNFDYYAYIDYDTFNPADDVHTIHIQNINRESTGTVTQLLDVITGYAASGTMISYKYGQELRPDPISTIVLGEEKTEWKGFNATASIWPYWGQSDNGSPLVFTNMNSVATTTNIDNPSGIILLDHIRGRAAASGLAGHIVKYWNIDYQRTAATGQYPPEVAKTLSFISQTGYYASQEVMRAALFSQESWEATLYKQQQSFAEDLGITSATFRDSTAFLSNPENIRAALQLAILGDGSINRTAQQEALIEAVYSATRSVAEEHYGKSWFVYIEDSEWANPGTTFNSTSHKPIKEFTPAEAAWAENVSTPSGFNNHILLLQSNDPTLRDDRGRFKPFLSFTNYNTIHNATYFPYEVDTSLIPRQNIFIEQGPKLVLPVTVQQYDLDPRYFIVTLQDTIQSKIRVTGYEDQQPYYDFLVKVMGYSDQNIKKYNLMEVGGENERYGLAPARPYKFLSAPDNYGLHLPIARRRQNFGPYYASGIDIGPVGLVNDSSLSPSTYGGYLNLGIAGQQLADQTVGTRKSIDLGEMQIAGKPEFNIGQSFGTNNNITSLSYQYGSEGLVTSYSIRTFAYPNIRITKLLTDKITSVYNRIENIRRQVIDLDQVKNTDSEGNQLFKPSQINAVAGGSKGKTKVNNTGASEDNGYLTDFVVPTLSGVYNPDDNDTYTFWYS